MVTFSACLFDLLLGLVASPEGIEKMSSLLNLMHVCRFVFGSHSEKRNAEECFCVFLRLWRLRIKQGKKEVGKIVLLILTSVVQRQIHLS
jgi:hypothetical protein